MSVEHSNGERPNGVQRVTITVDPHTLKLGIGYDCTTLEIALSLLERAHRELDALYRFTRGRELLQEQIEQTRLAQVAKDVLSGERFRT